MFACIQRTAPGSETNNLGKHENTRILPQVMHLVQSPNLRKPRTNWRREFSTGFDSPSPERKTVERDNVRVQGTHTKYSPTPKGYLAGGSRSAIRIFPLLHAAVRTGKRQTLGSIERHGMSGKVALLGTSRRARADFCQGESKLYPTTYLSRCSQQLHRFV